MRKSPWFSICCTLAAAASLQAAGPGVMVEGDFSALATDADGGIWAIAPGRGIAGFEGGKFHRHTVSGLNERMQPLQLAQFEDGDVSCLWEERDGLRRYLITRHRGGKSRLWSEFQAELRNPVIQGFADGAVLVTESGRNLVVIQADGKHPEVQTLPEALFLPPEKKQSDGSLSKDHSPILALRDASGVVCLWCRQRQSELWRWRLGGLVRLEADEHKLYKMGDAALPISAVVRWDEKRLAIAVAGAGLLLLPIDGSPREWVPEPEPEAFHYIETVFHDGASWHAIATPRPTEVVGASMSSTLPGRLELSERFYYDRTKATDTLWRFKDGKWQRVLDGLDKKPGFSGPGPRPWVRTGAGLFLASDVGVPWFIPNDIGSSPRRLAPEALFPLPNVSYMARAGEKQVLMLSPNRSLACLWPAAPPQLEPPSQRWERLTTRGQALQDDQGRIWCLRTDGSFQRWEGNEWISQPIPDEALNCNELGFCPDDRNRGWLLPRDNSATAICDLDSGKWQVFATVQEALQSQLPEGVKLAIPEHPFHEPAFSGDGRAGGFIGRDSVMLFSGGAWKTWNFHDIAGPDGRLRGKPFFDGAGRFSLPVGESTAWQWSDSGEKGWQIHDGVEIPEPGVDPRRSDFVIADGEMGETRVRGAQDRFGVTWWVKEGKGLHKNAFGRTLPVFSETEPNPFSFGGAVQAALADDRGRVLLRTSEFRSEHEHVFIHPRLRLPRTSLVVTENRDDCVRLCLGNETAGESWFTWRLNGGPWQSLSRKAEVLMQPLPIGRHCVEARAWNADLTPDPQTARVEFDVRYDMDRFAGGLIAQLTAGDLDQREAAARSLIAIGLPVLPKLQAVKSGADNSDQWWLDAVIQHIEGKHRGAS